MAACLLVFGIAISIDDCNILFRNGSDELRFNDGLFLAVGCFI